MMKPARVWNFKDLTGNRYGKLVVIKEDLANNSEHTYWICKCDCGNTKSIDGNHLRRGLTKSCGCLSRILTAQRSKKRAQDGAMPRNVTHGLRKTRLYSIWGNIKTRCYNQNNRAYKWYGAKGVAMCDEWRNDFANFYYWAVNNGYEPGLTIDRINPTSNYAPDNCRWIALCEQRKTTRRYVEQHGSNV